jgi:hypothetical protein
VAVFGQLDRLLRERSLTLADLKRQIDERYELAVDESVLADLAGQHRLGSIDMTTVAAAAGVLGVTLDDILFVVALPFNIKHPETNVNFLSEEETWRVWALLGMQSKRTLDDQEQREPESIVEASNRRSDEYFWRREARRRGVPFEDLRKEIEEDERIAKDESRREQATGRADVQRASASR